MPATLTLSQLPAPDVMVGDVTARVAYASLVVFDDRDDSGTLELSRPRRPPFAFEDERGFQPGRPDSLDVIYGASFVTMTAPDQRVAYREGAFDARERLLSARGLRSAAARLLRAGRRRFLRGGRPRGAAVRRAPAGGSVDLRGVCARRDDRS